MFLQIIVFLCCTIVILLEVEYTNKASNELLQTKERLRLIELEKRKIEKDIKNLIEEYESLLNLSQDENKELEKKIEILENALNLAQDVLLESFNTNTRVDTNNPHIANTNDLKIDV